MLYFVWVDFFFFFFLVEALNKKKSTIVLNEDDEVHRIYTFIFLKKVVLFDISLTLMKRCCSTSVPIKTLRSSLKPSASSPSWLPNVGILDSWLAAVIAHSCCGRS